MKVRPVFIYALIIAMSLLAIEFCITMYQSTLFVEPLAINEVKREKIYTDEEVYEGVLSMSRLHKIVLKRYDKDADRMYEFEGNKEQLEDFMISVEKILPSAITSFELVIEANKLATLVVCF